MKNLTNVLWELLHASGWKSFSINRLFNSKKFVKIELTSSPDFREFRQTNSLVLRVSY